MNTLESDSSGANSVVDYPDQFTQQRNTHLPKRKTMPQESDLDSLDGFTGQKTKNNSDEQKSEFATI